MTINRHVLVSLAASLTLALGAHAQSDEFAVSLTKSATSCGLTASFSGPANGTAILFAGVPAKTPIPTAYGKLFISNGLVRIKDIKLSTTGTGSASFAFPNGLTVGLQAAFVDAQGKITGLSSLGVITLQRSKGGAALACAWTTPQSGKPQAQMAIEAARNAKIELRESLNGSVVNPARSSYVAIWGGWRMLFLLPNRTYAVYIDGIFMGYLET